MSGREALWDVVFGPWVWSTDASITVEAKLEQSAAGRWGHWVWSKGDAGEKAGQVVGERRMRSVWDPLLAVWLLSGANPSVGVVVERGSTHYSGTSLVRVGSVYSLCGWGRLMPVESHWFPGAGVWVRASLGPVRPRVPSEAWGVCGRSERPSAVLAPWVSWGDRAFMVVDELGERHESLWEADRDCFVDGGTGLALYTWQFWWELGPMGRNLGYGLGCGGRFVGGG